MQAIAQSDTTDGCYLVHSFSNSTQIHTEQNNNGKLILPYMPILCIEKNGRKIWVHEQSKKETTISSAIGKAIELHEKKNNLTTKSNPTAFI